MKRGRRMFTRIQSLLHNAVEVLAPELPLLDTFRYHWKAVTQFFLETTDDRVSVTATSIPMHLEEMMKILEQEDQENTGGATALLHSYEGSKFIRRLESYLTETENTKMDRSEILPSTQGPCMEYMLQHKILETMQTLGKADCPPGMKQQVLIFFTNLLGKLRQQLLPHVNAHRPVHKLIRCCGEIKAAPTETEEVQFLCQVCSKLKQAPYLVNFFLEGTKDRGESFSSSDSGSPPMSPSSSSPRSIPEYSLINSLLELSRSEDSRVAIKACEGLLLTASLPEDQAATVLVLYTPFCERMADQLCRLFKSLPPTMDPADVSQVTAKWGLDIYSDSHDFSTFQGKRQLISFLSWLDYVDQLCKTSHPMVAKALGLAVRDNFLLTYLEPGLLQASEPGVISMTAVLTQCLKTVESQALIREFSSFVLGEAKGFEVQGQEGPHKLRHMLIQRIDHLSDLLSIETLKLFESLLLLPHEPIIDNLALRNLSDRGYFAAPAISNGEATEEEVSAAERNDSEQCTDENRNEDNETPVSQNQVGTFDKHRTEKVVNGFLMLLPDALKTSELAGESGYDTYLRDAHKQCAQRATLALEYDWPKSPCPKPGVKRDGEFYEGAFLNAIFKRLHRILEQPYDVNLMVTAVTSLLCQFSHPQLQEFLLDPVLPVKEDCLTPHRILEKVTSDLKSRAQRIPYFQQNLLSVRRKLMAASGGQTSIPNEELLESVIVLEEFCKELAAIAFVKATSSLQDH